MRNIDGRASMQTFTVEIDGIKLEIVRDDDGKFIIPDGWRGIGSALKPANEPICMARKPLEQGLSIAANVLKWGAGALNIDGCRVEAGDADLNGGRHRGNTQGHDGNSYGTGINKKSAQPYAQPIGRWPANVVTDGSDEVVAMFPTTTSPRIGNPNERTKGKTGMFQAGDGVADYRDAGSAARFFYSAKADSDDRLGTRHPTVK